MAIVSSSIVAIGTQIDGRAYIRERHIDSSGLEHFIEYLSAVGTDTAAILAIHAASLADALAQSEIEQNIQEVLA